MNEKGRIIDAIIDNINNFREEELFIFKKFPSLIFYSRKFKISLSL